MGFSIICKGFFCKDVSYSLVSLGELEKCIKVDLLLFKHRLHSLLCRLNSYKNRNNSDNTLMFLQQGIIWRQFVLKNIILKDIETA